MFLSQLLKVIITLNASYKFYFKAQNQGINNYQAGLIAFLLIK